MRALEGKVSLVLGASRGIGAATAQALAEQGAAVVVAARRASSVVPVADAIAAQGGEAFAVACDVADFSAVEGAVAATLSRFGQLNHLINNAATVQPIAALAETDPAAWADAIRVNVVGTYHGCRAALAHLRRSGDGVIINLSSGAAHRPLEGWSAYCTSKAATLMLTQSLALAEEAGGIRVYGFQPGAVDTGMLEEIRHAGLGDVSRLPRENLLPPQLPARVIAWLCTLQAADLAGRELTIRDPALRARVGLPEREYV